MSNKSPLALLGDALDHAEATDPSLRPRPRDCGGFAQRRPAKFERLSGGSFFWVVPHHAAVRAYWRELKADIGRHVYVEDTLRRCRRKFKLAWNSYDDLTIKRDSGAFFDRPSLRAILDARAVVVEAFTILEQVETSADALRMRKSNARAAVSDRKQRIDDPDAHMERRQRARRFK